MTNPYKITQGEMYEIIHALNKTSLGTRRVHSSILASVMVSAAYAHLLALDDAQDLYNEEQSAVDYYESDAEALASAGFGMDEDYNRDDYAF